MGVVSAVIFEIGVVLGGGSGRAARGPGGVRVVSARGRIDETGEIGDSGGRGGVGTETPVVEAAAAVVDVGLVVPRAFDAFIRGLAEGDEAKVVDEEGEERGEEKGGVDGEGSVDGLFREPLVGERRARNRRLSSLGTLDESRDGGGVDEGSEGRGGEEKATKLR